MSPPNQETATESEDNETQFVTIDLFAGAGGFSEAIANVTSDTEREHTGAAVNHWDPAIKTHRENHPTVKQYNATIEELHPPDVIETITGDRTTTVDLLTAGPECTHFAGARGGKPVSDQKRASAWHIIDWLHQIPGGVNNFIIENVPEITSWGPINSDGTPTRNGEIFDAWVNALNSLGYSVRWKTLNADEYGDATIRKRFFLLGSQTSEATFPQPTHGTDGETPTQPQRVARDILDTDNYGSQLWTRDLDRPRVQPLSGTTIDRISDGIERHCTWPLTALNTVTPDLDSSMITALRQQRIVAPTVANTLANTTTEPFLVPTQTDPVLGHMLVLRQAKGAHPIDPADRPLPSLQTSCGHQIVTLTVHSLTNYINPPERAAFEDLHTSTHQSPSYTQQTLAGDQASTQTETHTKMAADSDTLVLVLPELWPLAFNVNYRMITTTEAKRAHGFSDSYTLSGTQTEQKTQIGNSVPVNLATALIKHVLTTTQPSLSNYGATPNKSQSHTVPEYKKVN